MSIVLMLFCFGQAQLLEYRLWKNYGQVIYDYSGKGLHGTNGLGTNIDSFDCLFTDRGVYLSKFCMIRLPNFPLPNPLSIVFWLISDDIFYSEGYNSGRLFCRWSQTKYIFLIHNKPTSSARLKYTFFNLNTIDSQSGSWKTNEWVLIILEIDQNIIKIKKNNEVILQHSLLSNLDDSVNETRYINIGTDNSNTPGIGAFVWYAAMFSEIDIESQFLSTSSSTCFVGSCSECNLSFVIPSLGTGCASKSVSTSMDSNGNLCSSGYGCKGNLTIKCNCPSGSCEFSSEGVCSCIDSSIGNKYQSSCSCTSVGQGCCGDDCASCSNEYECLTCKASFSYSINGVCSCKDGYFNSSTNSSLNCLECMSECRTCINDATCTSCIDSFSELLNGRCHCKSGYFLSVPESQFKCLSCLSECKTCENSSNCLKCKESFYQVGDTCQRCNLPCETCLNSTYCLSCNTNYSSQGFQLINGSCLCPEGYYKQSDKCLKCLPECYSCDDGISCLTCKDQSMIIENDKKCKCKQGFYQNNSGSCISCPMACSNCILSENEKSTECIQCNKGYSLVSGYCFNICNLTDNQNQCVCPSGYIKVKDTCEEEYFNLSIIIHQNNSLDLQFSETLKDSLATSLISINSDFTHYSYKLSKYSNNHYQISFHFKSSVVKNTVFHLIIHKIVKSAKNKTLKNHEFSLLFNEFEAIQKVFQEIIKKTEDGAQICNIIAFFFAIFSNPSSGWVLVNTLQMIYFLPLSQKPLTPVANKFCKAIGKFNSLNLPKLFLKANSSDDPFEQARKIGIETSNVWINLGSNLTIFCIMIVMIPFLLLFSKIKIGSCNQRIKELLENYRYSFFLRFWLQNHLIFGVYSIINFETTTSDINIEASINKSFSFVFITMFISTPFIIFIEILVSHDLIKSNDSRYLCKYGSLFCEFYNEKGIVYLLFYPLLALRRVLFSFSQMYLNEFELVQRSLNLASSFCVFVYLARFRPFKDKIVMISNIFIEFLLCLVFALILGRSLFGFLKDDYIFDMCFTSFLIGGLIFQYVICLIGFAMKLKGLYQRYFKKNT